MNEIGEIQHIAGSGRVIIRISGPLPEGQILCDRGGTRVAKVMEIIGPVREPLASAAPLTNSIKKYVGKAVFAPQKQQDMRDEGRKDGGGQGRQDSRRQSRKDAKNTRRRRRR